MNFPETWFCDACGAERPDAAISVYKRDAGIADHGLAPGVIIENLKYCNDHAGCREKIKTMSLKDPAPRKQNL